MAKHRRLSTNAVAVRGFLFRGWNWRRRFQSCAARHRRFLGGLCPGQDTRWPELETKRSLRRCFSPWRREGQCFTSRNQPKNLDKSTNPRHNRGMSPRRWTVDAIRHPRLAGHFSSEAVSCTELMAAFGKNVTFNFCEPLSIRNSKLQHPSSREVPSSNLQRGGARPSLPGSSLRLGGSLKFGVWILKFSHHSHRLSRSVPAFIPIASA